jgi:eukaryotic-like serine/threonine-protein kinase
MARILIVDDDAPTRTLARYHVRACGHETLEAASADEALALLDNPPAALKPDLMLCDVMMPGIDGFTLVARIRLEEAWAGLPVIMLSGLDDRASMRRGMEVGADDFLTKPITRASLAKAIDARLRRVAAVRGELPPITQTLQAIAPTFSVNGLPAIEGYEVAQEIAKGGTGARVLLAKHLASGEAHVLKWVRLNEADYDVAEGETAPIDGSLDEKLGRFVQEYEIAQRAKHLHIARFYGQEFKRDHAYIAMEYLGGGTLGDVIEKGVKPDQAVEHATSIARGLAVLHVHAVIHRDLKPRNIMFRDNGTLVLTDFGISRFASDARSRGKGENLAQTLHGAVLGTPGYISPEQATGEAFDQRADFYALGVILYEMLTGVRPYVGDNAMTVMRQHVFSPVPTLPAPYAMAQPLIGALMAKNASDRPDSAVGVLKLFTRFWRNGGFSAAQPMSLAE